MLLLSFSPIKRVLKSITILNSDCLNILLLYFSCGNYQCFTMIGITNRVAMETINP